MKQIKWIAITLLCLFIAGSFNQVTAVDKQRQEYDKMVEDATKEADAYLNEKENQKKEAEAEAQVQKDTTLDERVQTEQARIHTEMDQVRGRGLSTTFSQGMKDNLLQQLQDKLDKLLSDPEAYFGGQ